MRKTVVLLGLVTLMVLGVTYAYAQAPGSDPGHKGMHESWGPGKDHSLTPEQKAKIQELRRNFRRENAKLIGAIVTKKLELESLWTDPKSDSKAILDKERELRDLRNQLKDKAVQMRLEVRKFLTPEQIQNWKPGRGMCGCHGMGGRGHMMGAGHEMGPRMCP
ncbi:MAG TPA: Spy/CpxP family protein refolding chaperone [Thermodesulfobacteriota bacterium]|nr:Spy/CpxP family protein refolding chaperone [Thermodesulfobacteriota bacterium]